MPNEFIIPDGSRKGKIIIKISPTKPIYMVRDEPDILVKVCPNNNHTLEEIEKQKRASTKVSCPKVIEFFKHNDNIFFLMEKLKGQTIYELYGGDPKKVPKKIWDQIHRIVTTLYYYNIHYLDISAHNFIVNDKNEVSVIDFGDAKIVEVNWFLKDFMDGEKAWNPDFF